MAFLLCSVLANLVCFVENEEEKKGFNHVCEQWIWTEWEYNCLDIFEHPEIPKRSAVSEFCLMPEAL